MMTDAALIEQINFTTPSVTYSSLSLRLQETITSTIGIVALTNSASPQVTILSVSDSVPRSKRVHDSIWLPTLIQNMSRGWIEYYVLDRYWRENIRGAIHTERDSRLQ